MSSNKKHYTIGEVSKLCNIPSKTLRFYDETGLLRPEDRDVENNYRQYSEKQILEIIIIKELKRLGFSLEDLKNFLRQKDLIILQKKLEELRQKTQQKLQEYEEQLNSIIETFNRVITGLNVLNLHQEIIDEKVNEQKYDIKIEEMPRVKVVYIRYFSTWDVKELFIERYAQLLKVRDENNLFSTGCLMAIFHDDYTTHFINDTGDLEVCMQVSNNSEDVPVTRYLGGFLAATTIHVGKYPDSILAYNALRDWVKKSEYESIGPAIEQYLVDPISTDNEDNYITKILLPIKSR